MLKKIEFWLDCFNCCTGDNDYSDQPPGPGQNTFNQFGVHINQPNNPPEPANFDQPRFTDYNQFDDGLSKEMKYDNTLYYNNNNNNPYDGGVPEPGQDHFSNNNNNNNSPPEPGFRTFE